MPITRLRVRMADEAVRSRTIIFRGAASQGEYGRQRRDDLEISRIITALAAWPDIGLAPAEFWAILIS